MPIYEYKCNECGHRFEALVRRSDEEISCEACGSEDLSRLMSAFAARVSEGGTGDLSCPTGTCPTGTCSLE